MTYFDKTCERCGTPIREVAEFCWVDEGGGDVCDHVHAHQPAETSTGLAIFLIRNSAGYWWAEHGEWEFSIEYAAIFTEVEESPPDGGEWVQFAEVPF